MVGRKRKAGKKQYIEKLKLKDLKKECEQVGLNSEGTKLDLFNKLQNFRNEELHKKSDTCNTSEESQEENNKGIIKNHRAAIVAENLS